MPFKPSALGAFIAVLIKLLTLLGADDTNFIILGAVLTIGVGDGVDV